MAILVLDVDGVVVLGHPEGGRWDKHLARDLGVASAALQDRFFRTHWRDIALGKTDLTEALREVPPSGRSCQGRYPASAFGRSDPATPLRRRPSRAPGVCPTGLPQDDRARDRKSV